jgi:hypothetical protein
MKVIKTEAGVHITLKDLDVDKLTTEISQRDAVELLEQLENILQGSSANKDTERLEWLINSQSLVRWHTTTQGRYYLIEDCNEEIDLTNYYRTAREAIDDAMKREREGK